MTQWGGQPARPVDDLRPRTGAESITKSNNHSYGGRTRILEIIPQVDVRVVVLVELAEERRPLLAAEYVAAEDG